MLEWEKDKGCEYPQFEVDLIVFTRLGAKMETITLPTNGYEDEMNEIHLGATGVEVEGIRNDIGYTGDITIGDLEGLDDLLSEIKGKGIDKKLVIALMEYGGPGDIDSLMNTLKDVVSEQYSLLGDIKSPEDLGKYTAEIEFPGITETDLGMYMDYTAYGRKVIRDGGYYLSTQGILCL